MSKTTSAAKKPQKKKPVKKNQSKKVVAKVKPEVQVIENLGALTFKKTSSLFVGLLPSNYKSVLVSYSRDSYTYYDDSYHSGNGKFKISCIIPPETHQVQVVKESYDYYSRNYYDRDREQDEGSIKSFKHQSPTTMFTINYHDFPKGETVQDASIFIVDAKQKNKITATPYLLPNVGGGFICFGSVGTPRDMRSAHTLFWNSPFNSSAEDGTSDAISNVEWVRRYKSLAKDYHDFQDMTKSVCGQKFWSTTQIAEGLLITNNQELLKQVPEKFWMRNSEGEPLLIVLAEPTENDRWKFWGKNFSFEIDSKYINTSRSNNKKLIQVMKKLDKAEAKAEKDKEKVEKDKVIATA